MIHFLDLPGVMGIAEGQVNLHGRYLGVRDEKIRN
jgi:hypothetical protein